LRLIARARFNRKITVALGEGAVIALAFAHAVVDML
jgi:6,7-dimethyl-8-ribityllumazine synthase